MLDGPMVSDKIRDLDGPFHCSGLDSTLNRIIAKGDMTGF